MHRTFSLRALLFAVGAVAVTLCAGVHFGPLGIVVGVFLTFLVVITTNRNATYLLGKIKGWLWWSGVTICVSAFFPIAVGPMGGQLRIWDIVVYSSSSFSDFANVIHLAWPPLFGAATATLVTADAIRSLERIHATLLFFAVLLVFGTRLGTAIVSGYAVPIDDLAVLTAIVSLATIAQIFFWSNPTGRLYTMYFLGALAVIHWCVLILPHTAGLNAYGLWILLIGTVTMTIASCIGLMKAAAVEPE